MAFDLGGLHKCSSLASGGFYALAVYSEATSLQGGSRQVAPGSSRLFAAHTLKFRFVLDGESRERMSAMETQLCANVGSMVLDRSYADAQLTGDLSAGLVLGQQ